MASISALFQATRRWVEQPYSGGENMDLWQWFAFVAMILSAAFLWSRVLAHIGE